MTGEKISVYVSLRLSIPAEVLAHLDLTAKDDEDDAPYYAVAEHVAENLVDLMDYAAPVDSDDMDVEFYP